MAGKLAKCSCGHILTIPSVPAPPSMAAAPLNGMLTAPTAISPTGESATPSREGSVLFQCNYGMVRPFLWWLLGANVIVALVLIPAGIFWNEGWSLARSPIPPWAATVLFEAVGFGLLFSVAYFVAGYLMHRQCPQRVAVTATGVILPKSKLSTKEHFLPWDQVRVKYWGGPVSNLDFKRGHLRTIRLVSIQFPTDDDFDTFVEYLRKNDKV